MTKIKNPKSKLIVGGSILLVISLTLLKWYPVPAALLLIGSIMGIWAGLRK